MLLDALIRAFPEVLVKVILPALSAILLALQIKKLLGPAAEAERLGKMSEKQLSHAVQQHIKDLREGQTELRRQLDECLDDSRATRPKNFPKIE